MSYGYAFPISALVGGILVGSVIVSMNLGHWYLISKGLPFSYLIRFSRMFVGAVVLRTLLGGLVLLIVWSATDFAAQENLDRLFSMDRNGVFFAIRVFWGIVGPLVLSFMVLQTAKIHSNTAATGILYVSLAFILMGELLSCYLLVSNSIPI